MSVVIETTLGTVTVDLYLSTRPRACLNFLKLCKIKYYNFNLFHTISRGFIAQTGDPTGSRSGGESIFGVIDGPEKRYFEYENEPRIKHTKMGLISFVGNDEQMIGSQFFITLGDDLIYLDEQHCVFGEVVEGFDILEVINEVICDTDDRPYQDVRITHTVVLDDPFPDPKNLKIPSRSPSPSADRLQGGRIAPDEDVDETEGKTAAEISEMQAEREAKARATILEMVGDIPDAEMAPPENVLFVCKLNPVTTDDDLEVIFNRFGKIKSCEVIRDRKTGDSLQYAFIEFEDQKSCEDAYFKMDNILIDDRRIHVDFSQSVSKVRWMGKGRGVKHYNERGELSNRDDRNIGKGDYKQKNNYKSDRNHYKSTDNKDNGRYSPYKTSDKNKHSRHRRSRSDNYKNYERPKSPIKEKDVKSRASYSKHKSSMDYSDRDLSSNKRYSSHRHRSRSKSFSRDCSKSKRYDEKSEGRDRYDESRRNRKENSQSERSSNNGRGIGKSRRNRSKSVESSSDRKNKIYQKTTQSKSEKNHKSKRHRSSSHSSDSDSEDHRSIHVDKKTKKRSKNDEIKKGIISIKKLKSKYREKSNATSSDSEDENKDQRISNVKKTKSYNSRLDSSDSDEHKAKSKKKSKSYQSTSSSDSDDKRYKKKNKSKVRKSCSPSTSDSDSDKRSKRKKKVKQKKKKYGRDSE